jgi:hypothetical protein
MRTAVSLRRPGRADVSPRADTARRRRIGQNHAKSMHPMKMPAIRRRGAAVAILHRTQRDRTPPRDTDTSMRILSRSLFAAGLALALAAAHLPAAAQSTVARWRGSGNEQMIDEAVRGFGFRPNRLTDAQLRAIDRAWGELLGHTTRRAALNRTQATAIVYMALVHPERGYGRPGGGGYGYGYDEEYDDDGYGRPGGGRPGGWDAGCDQMEADAYRLGNLVSAPADGSASLFVTDPDRGRARTLARQIQERAIECRATAAADRAGEVMAALAEAIPRRSDVAPRVEALKRAIQAGGPRR